jgi:tetratricopeptide (TPR) repeat protein
VAISLLERSLELDAGFAPAWSELGRRLLTDAFYWEGGPTGWDRARRATERALQLDPDLMDAAGTLVDLLVLDGKVIEAYRIAAGLVAHRPQSGYHYGLLAIALRYGGLVEEAVAACDRGHSIDPRDPRLRLCTWAYLWAGDSERAKAFASRATSLLWNNDVLARIALMEGNVEEARALWSRQVDPSAGRLRRDAVVACLEDRTEAAARFERDLEDVLSVHDPEWMFLSAGLFARCGLADDALSLLREAALGGYCVDPSPHVDPLLAPLESRDELVEIRNIASVCRERMRREVDRYRPPVTDALAKLGP